MLSSSPSTLRQQRGRESAASASCGPGFLACPGGRVSGGKRATCQAEALSRVKPHGTINADLAQKLIERRLELVRTCMDRPALAAKDQVTATGAVKAQKRLP